MKKRILILITLILCFFVTSCDKNNDAIKFKKEYESLNNQKNASGVEYRNIMISKNNPIVYKNANDIIAAIYAKETFVVYFGFNSCPWCRSVVPTLLEVAKDMELESLYYVDIKDIRNTLSVSNGNVVEDVKGSDDYYKLLDLLKNVLTDYTLYDEEGSIIETEQKRIYAPNVIAVVDGKATKMTTGISEKQNDANMDLSTEILNETYANFEEVISEVASSTCIQDAGC